MPTARLLLPVHLDSWGPSSQQVKDVANQAISGQWLIETSNEEDGDTGDTDFAQPEDIEEAERIEQLEHLLLIAS